jgi:hypothetical protein
MRLKELGADGDSHMGTYGPGWHRGPFSIRLIQIHNGVAAIGPFRKNHVPYGVNVLSYSLQFPNAQNHVKQNYEPYCFSCHLIPPLVFPFLVVFFVGGDNFFERCCGGDLATTSTARSKRAHALECCCSDLPDMQPLSRVNSRAPVIFGDATTMTKRPKVAAKIAECIAECAEIETMLGLFLAILLEANSKAALAIYSSVDNRAAQLRILNAAAEAVMEPDNFDLYSAVMNAAVRPAMKERDKLAHWCWGYSQSLPNDLLLSEPDDKLQLHFTAVTLRESGVPDVRFDPANVFVVTEADLIRMADRFREAKSFVSQITGAIWTKNTPLQRASIRQTLSNVPQIHEALDRIIEARKKNQEVQQPSPPLEPNGTA